MTVRHQTPAFKAEARAWAAYQASIALDYRDEREGLVRAEGAGYVDPSVRSRVIGAGWLAAYRERELHCRRRRGS